MQVSGVETRIVVHASALYGTGLIGAGTGGPLRPSTPGPMRTKD